MNSRATTGLQNPSVLNAGESHSPGLAPVSAEGVWKSYEEGSIQVLRGVDFEARAGQTVALCGPSGCGKSTLLHLLGGLDEPDRGRILVHGSDLATRRRTHFLRHEVGFVFQLHNLIPDLSLEENCLIPTVAAGTPRREAHARLHDHRGRSGLTRRRKPRNQEQ